MQTIDPKVELLADMPILGAHEDLLGHQRLAVRLVELAATQPAVPRVIALTGACGAGKSSVLRMFAEIVPERDALAMVSLDAQMHATAQALMDEVATELGRLFSELDVVKGSDKIRDMLVHYGGVVSSVIGLAGVKVDVSGALERSAASMRTEITRCLEQAGKQLIIAIDHLDRLPSEELGRAFTALRMYATVPSIAIVIAVDRHDLATRAATTGVHPRAFERLVDAELVMPPVDRRMLARVMESGLDHIAARIPHDLRPARVLFDVDDGLGLALIDTPRDAKRAINALSAALPLLPDDANTYVASLELVLRVLVPELDGARLE
ncbi:MAG: P-loop NTPase fold protein, partial [Kofleriaceae bacterium]